MALPGLVIALTRDLWLVLPSPGALVLSPAQGWNELPGL